MKNSKLTNQQLHNSIYKIIGIKGYESYEIHKIRFIPFIESSILNFTFFILNFCFFQKQKKFLVPLRTLYPRRVCCNSLESYHF
jgi:hypothetical protein